MEEESPAVGMPFSHICSKREEPQRDSLRFRNRLGSYCSEYLEDSKSEIISIIQQELGFDLPVVRVGYYSITEFFRTAALPDVLDSVTHIWRVLRKGQSPDMAYCWLEFVQRAFEEENLGYRVDREGGVHYFVDEEFERNRLAALRCLRNARYADAAAAFENSFHKLDSQPPDTKGAVLCILEAVESLFRLITSSERAAGLNSPEIKSALEPAVKKIYRDETSRVVAGHLLDGLCDWIEASHTYRNRQDAQGMSPPIGLANKIISSGSSYLRWLVEFDVLPG